MFDDNSQEILFKKRQLTYMIFSLIGMIIGIAAILKENNYYVILVALAIFLTSLASYYENDNIIKKDFLKEIIFSLIGSVIIIISSLVLKQIIGVLIGFSFIIIDTYKIIKRKKLK